MDPLSIAASIAGLASLSDVIFRRLFHYLKDTKNAEKDVKSLKDEVNALNGVLHNLLLVAQDLESDSTIIYSTGLDHVNSCLATLHTLEDEFDKVGLSAPRSKMRRTVKKLTWPFKAINVKKYVDELRQHRDNLNLALTADSITSLRKCLSLQEDLSKQMTELDIRLRNNEEIESRIKLSEEREKILDYFLAVDPGPNLRTSVRLRYATTGFWLRDNAVFSKWIRDSGTNVWMSGIPGAGKTVLSGLVIQECMARASTNRSVAYFYCDYKNRSTQIANNVLSSLVSQIARQNETCFGLLKDLYDKLHPQNQLKSSADLQQLVDLVQQMSNSFDDVRVVVDGLDECGDDVDEVTRTLASLSSGHNISLALLSRNETEIHDILAAPTCEHIEIAAQSKDIHHYVRTEIELRISNKQLRLRNPQLKEEIVQQLVAKANGM